MSEQSKRIGLIVAAMVAVLFGLATIWAGRQALFGSPEERAAVGNAVGFVLWFNFLAGFAYILAGAGLTMRRPWAARLSLAIALATLAVFAAFGVHIVLGGVYEMRTFGAMILRSAVWLSIAALAAQLLKPGIWNSPKDR